MLQQEGSGPLDSIPLAAVDAYPKNRHSAGSVGNSQSELPREKHHRIVIFPNKFIERKSGQMLPGRFQKPLKPQG